MSKTIFVLHDGLGFDVAVQILCRLLDVAPAPGMRDLNSLGVNFYG